ncbi:DUF6468 domain-containing protein [Teichococcus aestuarii]|uniref:DUF6468 domain-containing protein n=2 Tax=Teichococcus aestuarii TaxID=568898 RepID=UPI0036112F71
MTTLEWVLQGALALGLLVALPVAVRLERALTGLRRDREAMAASMKGFAEATREAEGATLRLRAAADSAGRGMAEQTASAQALREDLRFLVERAEGLADRLDAAIRQARGTAPAAARPAPSPVPSPVRSPAHAIPHPVAPPSLAEEEPAMPRTRVEHELLQALIRKRVS